MPSTLLYNAGMTNGGYTKIQEESGELVQAIAKHDAFPYDKEHPDGSNIEEHIEDEMGDVIAAITFAVEKRHLNRTRIMARAEKKLALFKHWDSLGDLKFSDELVSEEFRDGTYGQYAKDILLYLGVQNVHDITTAYPSVMEEVYDANEVNFHSVIREELDAKTENFSIGYLAFGIWDLGNLRCRCVAEQNASPMIFYVAKPQNYVNTPL